MTADDWPAVRRIYTEGIATGNATLEREAPDWGHFDRSHPTECRLVARSSAEGVVGWTALGGYSARKVYAGSRGRASTSPNLPAGRASAVGSSMR
jgi:phosphinothricin acetyltransferase